MKARYLLTTGVTCIALFCQSCVGLNGGMSNDAFAHAVKSGNHSETMRLMQPYSGQLQIQERNGKWYNPLQYAIANGDESASFALLQRGAPRSFDGKSLAYNAARVNHQHLAQSFASAGYGSSSDIRQAAEDARAAQRQQNLQNAAMLALGCVFLAALMGGGGSSSPQEIQGERDYERERNIQFAEGLRQQQEDARRHQEYIESQ